MANRGVTGPPPKDPSKRARNNKDPIPTRVVALVRSEAPSRLPDLHDWHSHTHDWWGMWTRSPLAADFTEADWDFLLDTAVIHSAFWKGDMRVAGELRLRVAKFGVTPEDRARLRIVFADADEKDKAGAQPAAPKYGSVRAIRAE